MKAIGIFLLLLVWQTSFSQWKDHFDDGDFTKNPNWSGSTTDFVVENGVLRLFAPAVTGSAYLSTPSDIVNQATWEISITLDFNPSSSNFAKLFLISDSPDLQQNLSGYFIKIGGTNDDICLYRQDGASEVLLIDGLDSRVSLAQVLVDIKVSRSVDGNWELFSKLPTEADWFVEGIASDITYNRSSYFGISCKYTSTRSNKFYFDNINVSGTPYQDIEPPILDTVFALNQNELILQFNEAIDPTSVAPELFSVNNSEPGELHVDSSKVTLVLNQGLLIKNELLVDAITDLSGNQLASTNYPFIFYAPIEVNTGDIVINEIMADPTPPEDLLEIEYLEIINRSANAIYMTEWSLSDKTTIVELPSIGILPDSIIVFYPNQESLSINLSNSVGLDRWPSLNNTTDSISLTNAEGEIIDWINYDMAWYKDEQKENGGWSLERIDPHNLCSISTNWRASTDLRGGTPGAPNAVFSLTNDVKPPEILSAIALHPDTILIEFNEALGLDLPEIKLDEQNYLPTYLNSLDRDELIAITPSIEPRVPYLLTAENISDCIGNETLSDSVYFILPEPAENGDIVISEILFNPTPQGKDFIEIYNPSPKYISLINWTISNASSDKVIAFDGQIAPNSYKVFTTDPDILMQEYPQSNYEALIQNDLPALDNDDGTVVLKNSKGIVVDSVVYNESWHFAYLDDVEGVSLERISPFRSGTDAGNWASASYLDDYATPGYKNSQTADGLAGNPIAIDPQVIVPDANGIDDFAQIIIDIDAANALATVNIYNLQGQLMREVANNTLVSSSTAFTWDGTDQQGAIVPLGHYVVVITTVFDSGVTETYREKVVVGAGF